jgi:hypothetical protein
MSYTITRNYNHDNAQKFGMMLIDYDLHYFDQRELAERLIDSLSYEFSHGGTQSLDDMVPQLLDEWLTTWTADVATMWIRNNCPQPEIDNHDESNNTNHRTNDTGTLRFGQSILERPNRFGQQRGRRSGSRRINLASGDSASRISLS